LHEYHEDVKSAVYKDDQKQWVNKMFWYGIQVKTKNVQEGSISKYMDTFPYHITLIQPGQFSNSVSYLTIPAYIRTKFLNQEGLVKKMDAEFDKFFQSLLDEARRTHMKLNNPDAYQEELDANKFKCAEFSGFGALLKKIAIDPKNSRDHDLPAADNHKRGSSTGKQNQLGAQQAEPSRNPDESEADVHASAEEVKFPASGRGVEPHAARRPEQIGKKRVTRETVPEDRGASAGGRVHGGGNAGTEEDDRLDLVSSEANPSETKGAKPEKRTRR